MIDIKNKKIKQKGFTLVETFVAIVILTIAVIGPLGLLSKAITDGNFAKNQITAYYLAQEGLELVIGQRDKNVFTGARWLNGLESCFSGECRLDFFGDNIVSCNLGNECSRLFIDDSTGLYSHKSGPLRSVFYRVIRIEELNTNKDAKVSVSVSWLHNGRLTNSFTIASFITNRGL